MKRAIVVMRDLGGVLGAGVLDFGVWEICHPAGFIVAGAMVLAAALAMAWREQG